MDEKTKQLVEQVRNNPALIQNLMNSRDGRSLMEMLTREDQGAALKRAAQSAARGDNTEMIRMMSNLMKSPEGADLVNRINRMIQK